MRTSPLARSPTVVILIALVALTSPSPAVTTTHADPGPFQIPPPRLVDLVDRQIDRHDRIYVSTPAWRREAHIGALSAQGLSQVRAHGDETLPAEIAWSDVSLLERRTSHFRAGQMLGAVVGAIALGYAGASVGESAGSVSGVSGDAVGTLIGMGVGALAGGWLGGHLGDQAERTTVLYKGVPESGNAPSQPLVFGTSAAPSAETIQRLARDNKPLRVRGSFGEVVGRFSTVDSQGLGGLTVDPELDHGGSLPPEPIPWSQVTRVDRRGNASGRWAAVSSLLFAGALGTLGAAVAASDVGGGSDADIYGGLALGAMTGAVFGAGLGALLGMGVPVWHGAHPAD